MPEDQVKKHFQQMLRSFTARSVLALLAEVFAESARKLHRRDADAAEFIPKGTSAV